MKIDFQKEYPNIKDEYIKTTTVIIAVDNRNIPCVTTIDKDINGLYHYNRKEWWLEDSEWNSAIKERLTPEQLYDDDWLFDNGYSWEHP